MDKFIFLLLAGIIAGFALLRLPLAGTFLSSLIPVFTWIAIIAIIVFSLYLIFKTFLAILGK
ncbi:hypothetical protein [Jeotgalibacillus campisalis]|uniref:Uncharacterized protein n=1 Tax=Jeotgalibacillus campisalis TaxID=220754 RepID=A0A0C2W4W2_9BACL|nr:hypothetical protein [Jeotgalibacillus campisalis]KIL51048.1 hypothetical protein KR50_09290 [Jeotgalibacillus campisalis]